MGTGILSVLAIASAFLIFCLTRGQKMREEKRFWPELFWYAGGLIPLTIVTVVWTIMENQAVPQRVLLIALGAALGGLSFYALGEWIRPTNAQTPPPLPPSVTGNCNNFGNNNFNCNIIGNLPLSFGDAEKSVLMGNVTKQRKIVISVIADGRAEDLAKKVFEYLKAGGYQVEPISHLMMAAGPNGPPRGVVINNPPDAAQPTSIMIGYP